MPVDHTHPQYDAAAGKWAKMRDVLGGQEQMHERETVYLPMPEGMTGREYSAFLARANFYNATGRTVQSLSGLLFRKPLLVEVPPRMEPWLEDLNMAGLSLQSFAEQLVSEILEVSRAGLLVDFPESDGSLVTEANAEKLGRRPFVSMYAAENITDWRVGRVNNRSTLIRVTLFETVEEDSDDEFEPATVDQYRVLDLFEGQYRVRVFRKAGGDWYVHSESFPKRNGQSLDYIPFIFVNDRDTSASVCRPVLLDLANINIGHYKNSADFEHGVHYTGMPTAVVTGVQLDEGDTLRIGSQEVWTFDNADADAKYLEFEGKGLGTLQEAMKDKEERMAALGARMLAPQKKAAEATDTEVIRRSGENGPLAAVAITVSNALTKALEIMRDWAGLTGDVSVEINRDFMPVAMSPEMLKQLTAAVQAGKISFETYFENLQDGEIIRPDKTADEELSEIQTGGMDAPPVIDDRSAPST